MTSTLGIVEVPSGCRDGLEHRLPGSSLAARRFGGKSLLEWVVRRVTESLLLDHVAVVTDTAQLPIIRSLAPQNVSVVGGEQADALGRVAATVRQLQASQIVRVPLCCPFIDPELIDRLVCAAGANPGCDYIGYFSVDGRPAVLSKVGLFAEWFRADALDRAAQLAKTPAERADSTRFIYSHPEQFQLRYIPVPARLDRPDVRLTIQLEEDWELAQTIVEALGHDGLDWQQIATLLDHQPALRARMANLNEAEVIS